MPDTETMLKNMYNVPSSGSSQFDGTKYIRLSNMVCSNAVVFELYQDSKKKKDGLVLLKAGSNSITNIGTGKSLLFKVDGEDYSFSSVDSITEHGELYFSQGATIPFSYKTYLISEEFVRKAALSNSLLTKMFLLNNSYIEGKCSPVTLREFQEHNKYLGVSVTQKDVDTGNKVAVIYGFKDFLNMSDSTSW